MNRDGRYSVMFCDESHPRREEADAVEDEVFFKYFGETRDDLERLYGRYTRRLFLLVRDERADEPAGVIRYSFFQEDSPYGFPELQLWKDIWGADPARLLAENIPDFDPRLAIDLTTIAVRPRWQMRVQVTDLLYRHTGKYTVEHGFRFWLASLQNTALAVIQARVANPFRRVEGIRPVETGWASETTPVWADVNEHLAHLEREDPDKYARFARGEGLTV